MTAPLLDPTALLFLVAAVLAAAGLFMLDGGDE